MTKRDGNALVKGRTSLQVVLESKQGATSASTPFRAVESQAMLKNDQGQTVGDGATAFQAGGNVNVVNFGVTVSEARAIAMDVAKATFFELAGTAKETAFARVEEITNHVIERLEKDYPAGLRKAKDPDFQYALFTVQKEYARNGDKDLGDLLVDLLVDRSKHDQRDILQIVLNESLSTAPKLTESHLAALAVIFLFKYTQLLSVINQDMFGDYLDAHVLPFISKLSKGNAGFQHLEFTGCGSIGVNSQTLEGVLGKVYQGHFLKGFDQIEVGKRAITVGLDARFFIPCLNDSSKFQVKANNEKSLEDFLASQGITMDDKAKIIKLFSLNKMSGPEIKGKMISSRSYMKDLIDIWNGSLMKSFTLTSVGMAIGHANIKRLIGEFADLSIWIN